jgi:hypothetical protein
MCFLYTNQLCLTSGISFRAADVFCAKAQRQQHGFICAKAQRQQHGFICAKAQRQQHDGGHDGGHFGNAIGLGVFADAGQLA